jgi:trk system potassium uptake protein TrkH
MVMACFMALPAALSIYYDDGAQWGFMTSIVIVFFLGLFFRNIVGRLPNYDFHEKESFWITSVVWIVVPAVCSLPYMLTGTMQNPVDALFESFSGFTSTGSTVITNFDHVPKSVFVWRSLTQWIGGLGFMLLSIAFIEKLRVGTPHLYTAEFSGTVQEKIHPRTSTTVKRMWYVYMFFTVVFLVVLLFLGNAFDDALCLSLSTVSTGGFSPRAGSIDSFGASTQLAIIVFMFLAGINISLLYYLLLRKPTRVWRSEEFRTYLVIIVVGAVLLSIVLAGQGVKIMNATSFSFFQVVSTVSTTGFHVSMPNGWTKVVPVFLFLLMFIGACSGSSGGGIKVARVMILFKYVRNQFVVMLHPRAVAPVKVDNKVIQVSYINKIFAFVFMYFVFIVLGAFVLMCCGMGLSDSLSVASANISNIGPVIETMGGDWSYAHLPLVAKFTIMIEMLLGRLEIFALMAIFSPSYWR